MDSVAKILFVDDEAQMLTALSRVFRGKKYNVISANSAAEGLAILENETVDVIVSDMRMPEMDGAQFLSKCLQLYPNSRRILLTGYSDQDSTVRAINEGKIHQYQTKPWDNDALKKTVEHEISEKRLQDEQISNIEENEQLKEQVINASSELANAQSFADMAKEDLLKQFNTTIKVISNLINIRLPIATTLANNVADHSVALAKLIKLDPKVTIQIRNAARLYQLGKLSFTDNLVDKPLDDLSFDDRIKYNSHAVMGADLLMPISSLDFTAKLIRHQNENYDGSGQPNNLSAKKIPLGSRILRLTIDYHQFILGIYYKEPLSWQDALSHMEGFTSKRYDPDLFKLYSRFIEKLAQTHTSVPFEDILTPLSQLEEDQVVSRDLFSHEGMLLVAKGSVLNTSMISKLLNYESCGHHGLHCFIEKNPSNLSIK